MLIVLCYFLCSAFLCKYPHINDIKKAVGMCFQQSVCFNCLAGTIDLDAASESAHQAAGYRLNDTPMFSPLKGNEETLRLAYVFIIV